MNIVSSTLIIRLTRLPDINTERAVLDHKLVQYGRFAIMRDGRFWIGMSNSSHPATTQTGWYWAVNSTGELLVSARGAAADGEALFAEKKNILFDLIEHLVKSRYIKKPSALQMII